MIRSLKIGDVKRHPYIDFYAIFDEQKIVKSILKAYMFREHEITRLSKKLNLEDIDLINILTHARIEITDNCVSEDGIQYLVDREVGKIKRYFEQSLANYTSLSAKEQRTFNAFLKRYGIKFREIKKWSDLKIEAIRKDCYNELTRDGVQIFYDGKYICYEELEADNDSNYSSIIQLIRSSLMFNMRNMRRWIQFKPISDSTITYILMHHFHIFTSDDSNSIHAAKQFTMFYLPQNAKNYIFAA